MRIAHIACTYPPYRGGIGNSAYHFARLTAEQGHKATVFTPVYKQKLASEEGNKSYTDNQTVIRLAPLLSYGNGAFLPQLFWRLSSFDLVHLHYPFFGSVPLIKFPLKSLLTSHRVLQRGQRIPPAILAGSPLPHMHLNVSSLSSPWLNDHTFCCLCGCNS